MPECGAAGRAKRANGEFGAKEKRVINGKYAVLGAFWRGFEASMVGYLLLSAKTKDTGRGAEAARMNTHWTV